MHRHVPAVRRCLACAEELHDRFHLLAIVIAQVKKASPSKGVIQPNFDPVKVQLLLLCIAGGKSVLACCTSAVFRCSSTVAEGALCKPFRVACSTHRAAAHANPPMPKPQIAQAYERGGAACLSVLTDAKFFQARSKEAWCVCCGAGWLCGVRCCGLSWAGRE